MSATVADVLRGDARWCVVEGDGAAIVPTLPAASINALVTDPPSAIAFMGARWDGDKGGRAQWIAWLASILAASRAAMADGSRAPRPNGSTSPPSPRTTAPRRQCVRFACGRSTTSRRERGACGT